MAVSGIPVIQGWGVEIHHLFSICRDVRYNLHLFKTVKAEVIMQPMSQGGIWFNRKNAPACTNERGHEQRMPTDVRTDVKGNAPQGQDGPEYSSDLRLVASKKKNVPVDLHPRPCEENHTIPHQTQFWKIPAFFWRCKVSHNPFEAPWLAEPAAQPCKKLD